MFIVMSCVVVWETNVSWAFLAELANMLTVLVKVASLKPGFSMSKA